MTRPATDDHDRTSQPACFVARVPLMFPVLDDRLTVRSLLWLAAVASLIVGSNKVLADESVQVAEQIEFFEKSVRPILTARCYECHSGQENQGGLRLDSRDGLLVGGDSGPALVPGNPDASRLIDAVRYENRDLQMPPENRLSRQEIATLEKWVALGAPDPRVPSSDVTARTGMSLAEGRQFWSFQPVTDPKIPTFDDHNWVRTPIDAFILAELKNHRLKPAPPADRVTLIRRVTFDLIGLPPTPAEVDAFLSDDSPDAFKEVVERLLASPQYGVRWARHWLDVARYADSNGLDENLAFGNAWRYRDYVVQAFNHDKPFDQFLVEQIAGDLLPSANRESRIATGFLSLGAKVLAEPDREKLVMDTIDEQLDTIGKAFMAMTLGCARCHDHKFDPLKQTDYYALAAIFKSTKTFGDTRTGAIKHWYEHSFATAEELAALQTIDTEIAAKKQAAAAFKDAATAKLRTKARSQAIEYLVAATTFGPDAPLTEITAIAASRGLHPRILHHCRLHLQYTRDDPILGKWYPLRDDPQAVRDHFAPLLARAEGAYSAALAADPMTETIDEEMLEAVRQRLDDPTGLLGVPAKPEHAFDPETLADYRRLLDEARIVESQAPDEPAAMGVCDGEIIDRLPIHVRGSHLNLGELVSREFPEVMRTSTVRPILPSIESGRLQLAQWMASTQHPLIARVYVNRVWRWHFGRGIVKSTENFGKLGDRPSHPELLDWLARQFMQAGWSTKDLHRLILASSVYQMSSQAGEAASTVDPENRLLASFRLQRLEAEQIRDALLAVSGRLDESLGGKTIPLRNRQFVFDHTSVDHTKYDSLRRAIYLPVIRNNIYTLFTQYDFPDPTMPTANRDSTVVAPQALLMMNSPLVMDSADELARQVLGLETDDRSRIVSIYRRALGRAPLESETARALDFLADITSPPAASSAGIDPARRHRMWSLLCHSLFASNEFIYVR